LVVYLEQQKGPIIVSRVSTSSSYLTRERQIAQQRYDNARRLTLASRPKRRFRMP
jgi:hypothetical protein